MKIRIKQIKNFVFGAIFTAITAISPFNSTDAAVVAHLYEITVPVVTQGREERELVTRDALKEILVRVAGSTEAGLLAEDETLVPRPSRMLQQFRYRKFAANEVIPPPPEGAKPYKQKLWLRFTQKAVADLLRQQGFPVWGKTRPATLLWLVVDDQKHRFLLGNNASHAVATLVQQEAKKRGLPVRLPLLDLADQSKLRVSDVWGNFEDTILDASKRYQAEAVLVGRIYLDYGKTWNSRWSLYHAGQRQDWEGNGSETLRLAIKTGLDKTAETLAALFAQVDTLLDREEVLLRVSNVKSLASYNRVLKYLRGLNVVSKVNVVEVSPDEAVFRLDTRSGRLGISQAISLGHLLEPGMVQPVNPEHSENNENGKKPLKIDLVYKLVP